MPTHPGFLPSLDRLTCHDRDDDRDGDRRRHRDS